MRFEYLAFSSIFLCAIVSAETTVEATRVKPISVALLASGPTRTGSCWTGSVAVNSANAWRCTVGNEIHDPCFTAGSNRSELVCDFDPATGQGGFNLKLTKPLPNAAADRGPTRPWILQFADGELCRPYTGTMPITDKGGIAYYCTQPGDKSGLPEECDVGLLADSLKEGRIWTATRVTYCRSPESKTGVAARKVETVPIETLWQ